MVHAGDPLLFSIRTLSRINLYVTQDDFRFLRRFDELLRKHENMVLVHHPIHGAGRLKELQKFYAEGAKSFAALTPTSLQPHDVKPTRPQGFKDQSAEDFLRGALQDDTRGDQMFYVLLDADLYLEDTKIQVFIRELALQHQHDTLMVKNLYLVSPRVDISIPRIVRYLTKIIDTGMNIEEVRAKLKAISVYLHIPAPSDTEAEAFLGLTEYEVYEVACRSVIATKNETKVLYHPPTVAEYRKLRGL